MKSRLVLCLAITIAFGCGKSEAPKVPLGTPQEAAPTGMAGQAKAALDSGNMLFRAKQYEAALAQYQASAKLAPGEASPLLGILMVADARNDQKLKTATLERLRGIDPSLADTTAVMPHSKMMQVHPPVPPAKSGS